MCFKWGIWWIISIWCISLQGWLIIWKFEIIFKFKSKFKVMFWIRIKWIRNVCINLIRTELNAIGMLSPHWNSSYNGKVKSKAKSQRINASQCFKRRTWEMSEVYCNDFLLKWQRTRVRTRARTWMCVRVIFKKDYANWLLRLFVWLIIFYDIWLYTISL